MKIIKKLKMLSLSVVKKLLANFEVRPNILLFQEYKLIDNIFYYNIDLAAYPKFNEYYFNFLESVL
jgi:hypothetical protein